MPLRKSWKIQTTFVSFAERKWWHRQPRNCLVGTSFIRTVYGLGFKGNKLVPLVDLTFCAPHYLASNRRGDLHPEDNSSPSNLNLHRLEQPRKLHLPHPMSIKCLPNLWLPTPGSNFLKDHLLHRQRLLIVLQVVLHNLQQ